MAMDNLKYWNPDFLYNRNIGRWSLENAFAQYPEHRSILQEVLQNVINCGEAIYSTTHRGGSGYPMDLTSVSNLYLKMEQEVERAFIEGGKLSSKNAQVLQDYYDELTKENKSLEKEVEKLKADLAMVTKGEKLNNTGIRKWREAREQEVKDIKADYDSKVKQLHSEYKTKVEALEQEVKENEEKRKLYYKWFNELKSKEGIDKTRGFWEARETLKNSDLVDFIKNVKSCFEKFHRLPMFLRKSEYDWLPEGIKPYNSVADFILNSEEVTGELYLYTYFFFTNSTKSGDTKLNEQLFNAAMKMNPLFEIYFNFISGDYYQVSKLRRKYKDANFDYTVPLPGFNYTKLEEKIEESRGNDPERYLNWIHNTFKHYEIIPKEKYLELTDIETWIKYLENHYIRKYLELGKLTDRSDESFEETEMSFYNKSLYKKILKIKGEKNES